MFFKFQIIVSHESIMPQNKIIKRIKARREGTLLSGGLVIITGGRGWWNMCCVPNRLSPGEKSISRKGIYGIVHKKNCRERSV